MSIRLLWEQQITNSQMLQTSRSTDLIIHVSSTTFMSFKLNNVVFEIVNNISVSHSFQVQVVTVMFVNDVIQSARGVCKKYWNLLVSSSSPSCSRGVCMCNIWLTSTGIEMSYVGDCFDVVRPLHLLNNRYNKLINSTNAVSWNFKSSAVLALPLHNAILVNHQNSNELHQHDYI